MLSEYYKRNGTQYNITLLIFLDVFIATTIITDPATILAVYSTFSRLTKADVVKRKRELKLQANSVCGRLQLAKNVRRLPTHAHVQPRTQILGTFSVINPVPSRGSEFVSIESRAGKRIM